MSDTNSLPVVLDIDDFSPVHADEEFWDLLCRLCAIYPNFKANMFTIPDLCSDLWLQDIGDKFPWIQMHYHGSLHADKDEWFGRKDIDIPDSRRGYFYNCFKAPWWRLDSVTAQTLNAMGILVANRAKVASIDGWVYEYDRGKEKMPAIWYQNDLFQTWHAHVTPQSGSCPTGIKDVWASMSTAFPQDVEFLFISDLVKRGWV